MSDQLPADTIETKPRPGGAPRLARGAGPLVLLLLVFAVFGNVLLAPHGRVLSEDGGDTVNREIWFRGFAFGHLREGHLPLWNPHIFGGAPFLGSFASGLLYPPNWLELVVPSHVAQNAYYAIHLYLAGLFTYACCRSRGLSAIAGTLAGATFMFCGPYFLHVRPGHPTVIGGMTWLPLVLLALDRLTDTGRWRWAVAGAAGVAMQVYAGAQHFYLGGIVFGVYALLLAGATAGSWQTRARPLAGYIVIYGLAALLSAAQLFPALEAKGESVRGEGVPIEFAATFSLPPENLATLLSPHVFGAIHDEDQPYVGRAYLWEVCLFAGVTGLILAIGALARRDPRRRFATTMVIISIVLALGYHTPLFKLLYHYLPGYNTFRGAAKFSVFAALFLAMLAAVGLDQLRVRETLATQRRRLTILAGVAALILVASLMVRGGDGAWAQTMQRIAASGESENADVDYTDAAFIRISATRAADTLLLAFGAAGVAVALVWLHGRTRYAAFPLVGLAMLELLMFARRNVQTTDAMPPLPPPWATVLAQHPGDYRVVLPAERWANWGMVYGFQNLYGYDSSSISKRFAQFLAFSQGQDPDAASQYVRFTQFPKYLNMLRTRFVLLPDVERPVVELPDPLPRALLVSNYAVGSGRDDVFARLASPAFDARDLVILESEPSIKPQPGDGRGTVSVDVISTDELRIKADVAAPTLLLITDNYSRLWRATALSPGPQETYDVLPANWVLRAIPLDAGSHHIRVRYEPRAVSVGLTVTGITLVALAGGGTWTFVRRRRSSMPDATATGGVTIR